MEEGNETRPDVSAALAPTLDATPPPPGMARPAVIVPPDDALPAGEVLGERYRIVKLVGRGGQGDVYRAEDLEVEGHVVALKLMHHGARGEVEKAEAMRELRMLAAVSHPAIVQFKDSGWYGARLFFVMPWLEGRSLEDAGRLSRAEARRIFETVAAGIAALHAKGMRHQDVKPSNIFLARVDGFEEAIPILLDLGVAARGDDAPVAGSPDYFAPEVAAIWPSGGEVIGPEADVFALALTLRNVLEPESAPSLDAFSREDLDRRAKEPIPPPSGRDLAFLRGSFERWLAVDPARRPSAAELMRELAVLTAPEDRRRERVRTLRRVAPYLVVLAVVLGAIGWWAQGELLMREKAAALAADEAARAAAEERAAQERATRAEGAAEDARRAEEAALERAARSAQDADARSREAQQALDRVRRAQQALGRAEGDRARLEEAIDGLTTALSAEAAARASERAAHQAERTEWERAQRAREEAAERQRRQLVEERDRALVAIAESEVRGRELEARVATLEARAGTAEARVSAADARATEAEARASAAEARVSTAEARASAAEARAAAAEARAAGAPAGSTEPGEPTLRRDPRIRGPGIRGRAVEVAPSAPEPPPAE